MIITFCGHSFYTPNNDDKEKLLRLFSEVSNNQPIIFYLGGYGGFDNFARICAKEYQKSHPTSKLIFVTPYLGKEYFTLENSKYLYDESIYPDIENVPLRYAISKRNEWMINHADYIFAYVFLHYGGAYNTLKYAHRKKKPCFNLCEKFELY